MTPERIAYKNGMKDGLRLYSYMKDGVSYVGSCGTTLKQALEDIDEMFEKEES